MMIGPRVAVIDYGMGNVWSVISALKYLGATVELVRDPEVLVRAEAMILPGVGSFRKGMENLKESRIDEAIRLAVSVNKARVLGICLGMQLLGSQSTEGGETANIEKCKIRQMMFLDSVGPFGDPRPSKSSPASFLFQWDLF